MTPSKRQYCSVCLYPQTVCLCDVIKPVNSKHQVIILQHPSECKHAKGSARLVALCLENSHLLVGEQSNDFDALQHQLTCQQNPSYLIYPTQQCQYVEQLALDSTKTGQQISPCNLIFIDGSWKKAYKILQLNPWLKQLPSLSFRQANHSQYQIRKASRSDSLSTLEAVKYCLDTLDNTNTAPLSAAFAAMINNQWQFMSDEVKARYGLTRSLPKNSGA